MTPTPAAALQPLAGYRLLRVLGRGSLAEVYEALDRDGQRVALKVLRLPEDEQGLAAQTHLREVRLGERLVHPGIVRVLASGSTGEHLYLAMEYVPGYDLRCHTAPSTLLPAVRVVALCTQLAEALAAAHALGIVHRDLKPANVLIDETSGAVKLADFGLARLGEAFSSRTGLMQGTPAYMAPEQLADGAVGPHTDLYALGVLLFELLSARRPFEADTLGALLQQVGRTPAPTLSTLRPELPAALVRLVAELLEPQGAHRPASAEVVAARLSAVQLELGSAGAPG